MKQPILFLIVFFLFYFPLQAQTFNTSRLIKDWKSDGTSQTIKAEVTYADLLQHINKQAFDQRIKELNDYLSKHANKRLEVRIIMYRILGKQELHLPLTVQDTQEMRRAITLAGLLDDPQLISETYTLYGERSDIAGLLFYDLKAIKIQKEIGSVYFPMLWLRYMSVSDALFHTLEFTQSIRFGRECLYLMKSPVPNTRQYILQLDILGACYWETGNADSTQYFYQEIGNVLSRYPVNDSAYMKIWKGIVKGGQGMALFLQKKYAEAKPLLQQNVTSSYSLDQWEDAAKAENILAQIHFTEKKYDSALVAWKNAWQWARQSNDLIQAKTAVGGIRDTYEITKKYDSAYVYDGIYYTYQDTLIKGLEQYRLAAIQARIEFSNMEANLINDQAYIRHQIHVRNAILLAIVAVALFIALLFYTYHNKQGRQREELRHRQELSQREADLAKEQLGDFSKSIAEKVQMIEMLQAKMDGEIDETIVHELRHFTILTDEDWVNFKEMFEKVHPGFWTRLEEKFPHLTLSEKRFMSLSRLGMDNKEMAAASGVSPQTIRVLTFRLRKKLSITETSDLRDIANAI